MRLLTWPTTLCSGVQRKIKIHYALMFVSCKKISSYVRVFNFITYIWKMQSNMILECSCEFVEDVGRTANNSNWFFFKYVSWYCLHHFVFAVLTEKHTNQLYRLLSSTTTTNLLNVIQYLRLFMEEYEEFGDITNMSTGISINFCVSVLYGYLKWFPFETKTYVLQTMLHLLRQQMSVLLVVKK